MKKHIIGFTLFSIIVGTAAFIYAMFNVVNVGEVFTPAYTQTYQRNSCWKMKRNLKETINSSTITQAIFNLKTKKFSWNLSTVETDSPILLHFFVNDGKGTRYIGSDPAKNLVSDGELNFSRSYTKLDKINSQTNLYLIAEMNAPSSYYEDQKSRQIKFDASKAVAVTVDYGE